MFTTIGVPIEFPIYYFRNLILERPLSYSCMKNENNNNKVILMQIETHPEWYISVPRLNAKFSLR